MRLKNIFRKSMGIKYNKAEDFAVYVAVKCISIGIWIVFNQNIN